MALVTADPVVKLTIGSNVFTIDSTPFNIPDTAVDAAVSQGCKLVDAKPSPAKAPARPAPVKPTPKG